MERGQGQFSKVREFEVEPDIVREINYAGTKQFFARGTLTDINARWSKADASMSSGDYRIDYRIEQPVRLPKAMNTGENNESLNADSV